MGVSQQFWSVDGRMDWGLTTGGKVMRGQFRSQRPTPSFRRFVHMMNIWRKRGLSAERIDAFIRGKVLGDLAKAEAALRLPAPSLN